MYACFGVQSNVLTIIYSGCLDNLGGHSSVYWNLVRYVFMTKQQCVVLALFPLHINWMMKQFYNSVIVVGKFGFGWTNKSLIDWWKYWHAPLETYTQLMDLDCGLCGRTADVQTVNFWINLNLKHCIIQYSKINSNRKTFFFSLLMLHLFFFSLLFTSHWSVLLAFRFFLSAPIKAS